MVAGGDGDGAVAAGGPDEFLDAPTGLGFDPMADRPRGDHDTQVRVDRFAQVVVDRPGLQVAFGHAEAFRDVPELVVGTDHEVGITSPSPPPPSPSWPHRATNPSPTTTSTPTATTGPTN